MVDYYEMLFKRKSFHLFRGADVISENALCELKNFVMVIKPLDENIHTKIRIVPESETTCTRGAQYYILFYSEPQRNYLRNIGYIGEQIDLYLASKDIGALWFGIGRPKQPAPDGMEFVIMMAISKMPAEKFRRDMFKAKRKPLSEIWEGELLPAANIVRFSPSACNTQPWIVGHQDNTLFVYQYKKPGKRGIMPADKVRFYNKIDIGIFLFILETCLDHDGYEFTDVQYTEYAAEDEERILAAKYRLHAK
ncbi:MAG: nitroreductase family protein [Lachnospiraceae bacterium]|nr:nitroreductase family protein [Lachnospiraceae bacterium]